MSYSPQYITQYQIKWRLFNLVIFTNEPNPDPVVFGNGITDDQLDEIIVFSESDVEYKLQALYQTPFIGADGTPFVNLPPQTISTIQNLCIWRTCFELLSIDFGREDNTRGESYKKNVEKKYNDTINSFYEMAAQGRFKNSPLANLKLNDQINIWGTPPTGPLLVAIANERGQALRYAINQINDPSLSLVLNNAPRTVDI